MIPIIDTHQHLWDTSRLRLPWIEPGSKLGRNHVMKDYLAAAEGLGIVKTIYMEVDVAPEDKGKEVLLINDLCGRADNPMVAAVVGGEIGTPGFQNYVLQYLNGRHIKGVREVLHGNKPKGKCLKPEFVRDIRFLGEHGFRFDLCLRPTDLLDGAKLIELCPETQFVLDHCGNAPLYEDRKQWQRDIAAVARKPNVVCKISGVIALAKPDFKPALMAPIVQHCRDLFGPERIIWASDWPVCTLGATLRQWVETAMEITSGWSEADRRRLFHDNAERFYQLNPK
jgi:L-fuconolactonase